MNNISIKNRIFKIAEKLHMKEVLASGEVVDEVRNVQSRLKATLVKNEGVYSLVVSDLDSGEDLYSVPEIKTLEDAYVKAKKILGLGRKFKQNKINVW
jgi:hypothetical protein